MKFGIILKNGSRRKTLPLVEAPDEFAARFVAAIDYDELFNAGWEFSTVEAEPYWWNNCLYGGNAVGHSHGFCTADSCY